MTVSETVSFPGTMTSLWRRAPLWRFSFMSAALLTLLFILFPPGEPPPDDYAKTLSATATYAPQAPASPSVADAGRSAPQTADLSLSTANNTENDAIKRETGLDAATLGRLFNGSVTVNGFKIPLTGDDWALLAAAKITSAKSSGVVYFLGTIVHKQLVKGLIITAVRTKPSVPDGGEKLNWAKQSALFKSPECASGEGAHVQSFWMIYDWFSSSWHKWADRSEKMNNIERAAAGNMDAKGILYPQDMVGVRFIRAEKWGLITAVYLFNPEVEKITSGTALSFVDSDWYVSNIHRHPDKLAYVERLKQWAASLWPQFKQSFDAGQ